MDDLENRIDSNTNIPDEMKWLVFRLARRLLPEKYGGTWMREEYPGIFRYRPFNVTAYEEKHSTSHTTLWRQLNKLECAGVIERYHFRGKTLVDVRAMPLLAQPENISFSSPTLFQIETTINNDITKSQDSIINHLKQCIGDDKRIVVRSWLPGSPKYFQPKHACRVDIEKYLEGDRYHLYGSHLRCADDTASHLYYDVDSSHSWIDTHHRTIQKQLACQGFSSIYAPRSKGRGHLAIPFSSPVNAKAAHHALVQAAPALGVRNLEVYPVGGNRAISWPFYYVEKTEDTEVRESPIIAYLAGELLKPLESPGICSDRAGVERIFSVAINDASLIRHLEPEPTVPTGNSYGLPVSADIAEAIARAGFNACHSVTEVLGMKVNDRFLSPWRFPTENTPSAVIVSAHLVVDFGMKNNPGGKPQYHDAYDCHLAKMGGAL